MFSNIGPNSMEATKGKTGSNEWSLLDHHRPSDHFLKKWANAGLFLQQINVK